MRQSTKLAVVALGMLGAGLGAAPAVASPGGWEEQHYEWGETVEDFCDVEGLTVEDVGSGDSRDRIDIRDGLPYLEGFALDTDVYTNLATGESVTVVQKRHDMEFKVTDNGDGTLTIIYQNEATTRVYDNQGDVIARSAGSISVEALWDNAGTITDRDDDTPISFTRLRTSGNQLDFCAVLIPAVT